jgi:hypothetical protein
MRQKDPDDPPRGYTTEDVAAAPPPPPRKRRRQFTVASLLSLIVLIPVLVVVLWTAIALHWSYSSGQRVGYVQKFSKKGWLCKTWEGELSMVIPGQAQIVVPQGSGAGLNTFDFTIRDDAVAKQIQDSEGKHVSLTYQQHIGVPFSCFGETQYFVTGVRVVQ